MKEEEYIFDEMPSGWFDKIYIDFGNEYAARFFTETGEKPEETPKMNRMRIIMPNTPAWDHISETVPFCGLDMKGSITITTEEFEEVTAEEWDQIEVWANDIPNLNVDEILKNKLLHVYTVPAVITTLERM